MSELNAISAFMRAVVPWPGSEQEPGYVSIWYGFTVPDKKQPMFVGWPYKDISKFMAGAKWCIDHPDRAPAVYFCTSLQAKKRTKLKNGKQRDVASKSAADAISLKAIWIDIDVRPKDASGKHYVSFNEAGKAIDAFVKKHGLPTPTIVHSGGGFHVYWISDKALTPDEWHPYASGLKALLMQDQLKCDHGLTTDAARILRLPGSVNRKNPLQPVEVGVLKNFPVVQYDFKLLDFLKQHATEAAPKHTSTSVFADGVDPKIFTKPSSVFPPSNELSLSAGIERLVDFRPIFSKGGCPMYRDAFKNGGAGLSQPLWHLQILGTVFMENGNAIAHEISKEHTSYTPDSTDEMFGRKVAERNSIGLGYPSCATFKGAGCTACEGCPLLGKIKSPLNIRPGPNHSGGTGGQQTPKAGKKSGDSAGERLVVPKDDHMDRARIYRNRKRPNLYHYRDDYYDHEGGHYTIIADDTIRADLYGFLDHCDKEVPCKGKPAETKVVSFAPNKSSVSETGEALKAVGHVMPTVEQPHWLDRRTGPNPADLICFPNGILNINSNQFTPPDPALFTPHGVGFDYDPNAAAPTEWLNFLDQIFNGEADQIGSLQEMFGYCLSSDVSQEKVFMLLGDKRSGKDTMRHTLQSLLSPTAICGPTLDSMGTNFGMSQLIGKQLAVVGDMRLGSKCDKDLLAENVLKLSGRGLFTIDRKYKSHWTGTLPCKLWLISNEMPKLNDTSGALPSRMIIYRTRTSFYGREDRHLFRDKIGPELPAILLWALEGLRRMRQRGPIAEPACSIEMREELAREGSPLMAFVEECLTLDPTATVDKNVMYSAYLDFAHHNGLRAADKGWFYRNLDTATASKVKAERVQKGGVRVHNVVGARISDPPPRRPPKNEPIVVYATAPTAATNTAQDTGNASEGHADLDEMVENLRTSKTA